MISRLVSSKAATLGLLCLTGCTTSSIRSMPSSLVEIERVRDTYVSQAEQNGFTLPFVPGVKEWTRPSLISWRQEAKTVAIPKWEELPPAQQTLIATMAGESIDSKRFFDLLFRWFLVPHELTHAYQDKFGIPDSPARSERFANDMATAFHNSEKDSAPKLAELERVLEQAQKRLPDPLDDAAFDAHYQKMDPTLYAASQVRFILDSLKRRGSLDFARLIGDLPLSVRAIKRLPLSVRLVPMPDARTLPASALPAPEIKATDATIPTDRLSALQEVVSDLNKNGAPLLDAVFEGLVGKKRLQVNVVALAGVPAPYDAWCSRLDGADTVFVNLSLWETNRIREKGRPLLIHEITHFLLRQLNQPDPHTPLERLQDITFNEGLAHFTGRPGNPLSILNTHKAERQVAEKALANAITVLSSGGASSKEAEVLLRRANTGSYWDKFAAIAGMFQVADIYRDKGTAGVRELIINRTK